MLKTAVTVAVLLLGVQTVEAQNYATRRMLQRPTVSPYLNLLRNDGVAGLPNYFTLVRPQLEQREQLNRQQAEINRLERRPATILSNVPDAARTGAAVDVRATGHPTHFMNHSHYYPQRTRR